MVAGDFAKILLSLDASAVDSMLLQKFAQALLRGHISARVLARTWAEGEASDVQAPFAGISYVVFGSWDLGKPLSPT